MTTPKDIEGLVERLFASDEASALTNEAARSLRTLQEERDEAVRVLRDLANKVDEDGLVSVWAISDAREFLARQALEQSK